MIQTLLYRGLFTKWKYKMMRNFMVPIITKVQSFIRMYQKRHRYVKIIRNIRDSAMTTIKKFMKGYIEFNKRKFEIRKVAYQSLLER